MASISTALIHQYGDTLQHLVQQMLTKLRGTVTVDTDFTGEDKGYDQLGQTSVTVRTARNQATPLIDSSWDKRWLYATEYLHAFMVDNVDRIAMAIDPNSGLLRAQAMAFAREQDKVIYTALLGTAKSGKAAGTSNSISQTVTASSGLTVDKILEVKRVMDLANCAEPEEDPRYFLITPFEVKTLLNTTEFKSSDYNSVQALARGNLRESWCGFNFVVLPPTYNASDTAITNGIITRATATTVNSCVAYTRSSLMFGIKKDLQTRITEESTRNFSVQLWANMIMGAVRMEEAKVVAVNVTSAN